MGLPIGLRSEELNGHFTISDDVIYFFRGIIVDVVHMLNGYHNFSHRYESGDLNGHFLKYFS